MRCVVCHVKTPESNCLKMSTRGIVFVTKLHKPKCQHEQGDLAKKIVFLSFPSSQIANQQESKRNDEFHNEFVKETFCSFHEHH